MNYIDDKTKYDTLYTIGDTHGENLSIAPMLLGNDSELRKCVLHCGDFGIGFSSYVGDREMMRKLNRRMIKYNITLYAIRGNHDNPVYFNDEKSHFGLSNVILVPDHTILNLIVEGKDKVVYLNGGAVSVDRVNRTPSKSYWWNEAVNRLSEHDLAGIPDNLDIVITHTRPKGVFPISKDNIKFWMEKDMSLERDLDIELDIISDIFDNINSKNPEYQHFYGHFHTSNLDIIGDVKHKLLNIKEICEVR
tara:strand:- start:1325 stop:2071 length:747 start_codon:yes stop_codon:yes gene_type:complete